MFVKGKSGNPNGAPRKPEIAELRKAIKAVQKKRGCSLLKHFVERAYENDRVLIALGKKIIPDLSRVDSKVDMANDFARILHEIANAHRKP